MKSRSTESASTASSSRSANVRQRRRVAVGPSDRGEPLDEAPLVDRRRRRFRQNGVRRVDSARAALAFVESVGLCSTFHVLPDGVPCLWEAVVGRAKPRWPRHSHHDAGVALTWELKNVLPARRRVYYGKLVKGRPVLVALDLFPAFYALVRGRQRARDYRVEYEAGRLSHTAKRLMDVLARHHPLYTREWRAECLLLGSGPTPEVAPPVAALPRALFA